MEDVILIIIEEDGKRFLSCAVIDDGFLVSSFIELSLVEVVLGGGGIDL